MITRSDVQRVIDAFILKESLYWWLHPIERVQTVRGNDAWDGYRWTLARQLAQDREWMSLKAYMDTIGESYLSECMQHLIQSTSPRLYREYWTVCREEEENPWESLNAGEFLKMGVGLLVCWPKRPKLVINWGVINGINEWEPKVLRVITDVYLVRGKDDSTTK